MRVHDHAVRLAAVLIGGTIAASGIWAAGGVASAGPVALARGGYLTSVYCTARSNCWAVGQQRTAGDAVLNQALHWNGTTWKKVNVPSPGGAGAGDSSEPAAVRCASAKECWAAGFSQRNGGPALSEMLHWTGKKWYAMSVPQPAGTGKTAQNVLTDVTCIAARNCWAVGSFGKAGSSRLNLVLHWNGAKWTRVRVPEAGGTGKQAISELNSVRCPTASRCLAVGSYTSGTGSPEPFNQVLTWNGRSWVAQRLPNPGTGTPDFENSLIGAGCGAKASCWAVGSREATSTGGTLDQILRWNGRSWSRQLTSQPGGIASGAQNQLAGVTCNSDRNCWAVGFYGPSGPKFLRNQAQHWNGKHWVIAATPDPSLPGAVASDVLLDVRCPSGADCWAVGAEQNPGQVSNEILHWNGTKWSVWPPA
jgi:hypothetical protein